MGFLTPRPVQRGNLAQPLTASGARAMIVGCGAGP